MKTKKKKGKKTYLNAARHLKMEMHCKANREARTLK